MRMIARVAVEAATFAIDKPYDYLIPDELRPRAKPGMRVIIPFSRGNKKTEGIILEVVEESEFKNLKRISELLDDEPVITTEQLKLAAWMKSRFFCTIYDAVRAMLPAGLWFKSSNLCKIAPGVDKAFAYEKAGDDKKLIKLLDILYQTGGSRSIDELAKLMGSKVSGLMSRLQKEGVLTYHMSVKRRVSDKTVDTAVLAVSAEEALEASEKKKRSAPQQSEILKLLSDFEEAEIKEICYFTGAGRSSLKALEKAGYIRIEKREVFRRPLHSDSSAPLIEQLNSEQTKAYEGIKKLMQSDAANAALLYGVTGSGKTAVYIKLLSDIISEGKDAIVLVPEIALTPQLVATFTRHFGDKIAVLHSSLTMGERYDEWKRVKTGIVNIVVGTRSAVFAPVKNLGLIIIDEEQESTYKSENPPRYHSRDIAKYLCVQNNALLLMGSATPAIESMYSVQAGKYHLFTLRGRFNEMAMPKVIISDMKAELREGKGAVIGSDLKHELEENIKNGSQSILFINRRGTSSIITCPECTHLYTCPDCSVRLTYHSANRRLMCHYCGHSERIGERCPKCGGLLKFIGIGTQKVEEEIENLFQGTQILRMDTDTITASRSHETILKEFSEKKIPILIGTQMVTKGLNFENVTLVGVINADQSLYASDYRAHERTFSLITQVVGRSGRGSRPGRAVIQTFTPENEVIKYAAAQDYDGFYEREIAIRRMTGSPPFTQLYCLSVSGLDEQLVLLCCRELKSALINSLKDIKDLSVLGPAPAPVVKVKNRFRYRVFVRCRPGKRVRAVIAAAIKKFNMDKRYRKVSVFGDVNPLD
jgi:primosomal protein N' (replication factor Y)